MAFARKVFHIVGAITVGYVGRLFFNNLPETVVFTQFSNLFRTSHFGQNYRNMSSKIAALSPGDPNSFSTPELCVVTHIYMNLDVDFVKQTLSGYVDLTVEKKDNKAEHLVLDTRDLTIKNIIDQGTGAKLDFHLGEPVATFGSKLEIRLPNTDQNKETVRIEYTTSPSSSALQWLTPQQTTGKKLPYMFSQCQAIHARSMLPCQDTPSVKATYSALIRAPKDIVVLMSAVRDGEEVLDDSRKAFKFVQKVPIPSYLIAIVAGALESRKLGPRSHVWSEKEYIEKAAAEFSETEQMLQTAEKLLGPYVWGSYDLLVLPASFPFGGMENPCLTFVTPTILAGDKSLADVIAHEISHSWTGNLVTNKNFEHFWLNEGFTVFVERKIVGRMHGEAHRHFEAIGGWKELQYTIDTRGKDDPLTKLVPDLKGVDPDDAFSSVPYEKGHTFLFYLEEKLGGPETFEPFLRAYIQKFQYKSIGTDDWKAFLDEYFHDKQDVLKDVDWDTWLYSPGMPPVKPNYDTTLVDRCTELCKQWVQATDLSSFSAEDIRNMSSQQVREFLAQLLQEEPLPIPKLQALTDVYNLRAVNNSEIRFRWLRLGLRAHWQEIVPLALKFATEQGRMKFVRPIFRDLYAWEETREAAIATYHSHKQEMMHVSAYTLSKDLHL